MPLARRLPRTVLPALCGLFLLSAPTSAAAASKAVSGEERDIAAIRKRYYGLQERLPSLEHIERKLCSDPEKHWTCTDFEAWIENDRIAKLVYGGGEEGYWTSTELFLDSRGDIVFVFVRSENGRQDPSEIDESRTYVKDDRIIRRICRSGTSDDIDTQPQNPCPAGASGIQGDQEELDRFREATGRN